jgi:very-long-chain (3R)-3-hydroxyacyl-CoA dehydratase
VRAPILTTGMQVASRLLLVWPVVNTFPDLATSAGYSSMLVAWSVTEVIRYSYFVLALSGYQPSFISWLRYNTFYVLYPLGISSECWLVYSAIEPARSLRQEFAWVLQLILLVYVPGQYPRTRYKERLITGSRLVYPLYTHDGAEAKGIEREAGAKI